MQEYFSLSLLVSIKKCVSASKIQTYTFTTYTFVWTINVCAILYYNKVYIDCVMPCKNPDLHQSHT